MSTVYGRNWKKEVRTAMQYHCAAAVGSVDLALFVCSDLSDIKDLQLVILSTFSSQSEEVRSAASYALGNVCVHVCSVIVPFVKSCVPWPSFQCMYLVCLSVRAIGKCLG